jgi:hypothetical protein
VNARHCLLSTVLICVAAALAGCGGGSSTAANTPEAHLAALANATCREFHTNRATGAPFEAHMKAEFAKVRALIHSDRKLPRVSTFISDSAAQRRVQAAILREASPGKVFRRKEGKGANAFSLLEESYRLEVKVQADLKALGLTSCLGPTPRKPIGG